MLNQKPFAPNAKSQRFKATGFDVKPDITLLSELVAKLDRKQRETNQDQQQTT